jgi:Polysaccharide biosynthesis C-terminal domain
MGKTASLFRRDLVSFGIRLPLIVIGLVAGGLIGIVSARCASGLVVMIINMVMVRRLLGLSCYDQIRMNGRSLISVAVMVIGVYLVGQAIGDVDGRLRLATRIVIEVTAGAVFYVCTTWALWHLAGRPEGPEREVLTVMENILELFTGQYREV